MWFILISDIESDRHYPEGELLNMAEMIHLLSQCHDAKAHVFASLDLALEWNANDGM